jgi:short subunit dehydrogenase-like uncharacterized protein
MNWIVYGANGYTGELIAREAVSRGLRPVLAGRNGPAVQALATELQLEHRVFSLDDAGALAAGLAGMQLVMHCAGPFSATSAPMLEACLASGAHYLDITGEISVFEHAWQQSERARKADVVLCPGTGFDVVPTDCLAASLAGILPAAVELTLAFEAGGGLSPGTARTSVEALASGGCVRKDGVLKTVPLGWKTREIPFRHASRQAITIPWGDVFTAWVSTGVPNIEVYLSMPPGAIKRLRRMAWMQPLLGLSVVQKFLRKRVARSVSGPSEETRASSGVQLWAEAVSMDGRRVSGTLAGPNGYDITVTASLGIVQHLMSAEVEGGYYTPSLLMGPAYAATLPGVDMQLGRPV